MPLKIRPRKSENEMATLHVSVTREESHYGKLTFADKMWIDEEEPGSAPEPLVILLRGLKQNSNEGLADACLSALYDHHQVSDDFKDGDEIEVVLPEGQMLGTFLVRSFEVYPANEEMMTVGEKKYGVKYDGMDGVKNNGFDTIEEAATYVKKQWMGIDYMNSDTHFHNDYGNFYLRGFTLNDIGKITGKGPLAEFTFQSDCPHASSINATCVKCGKKLFEEGDKR